MQQALWLQNTQMQEPWEKKKMYENMNNSKADYFYKQIISTKSVSGYQI